MYETVGHVTFLNLLSPRNFLLGVPTQIMTLNVYSRNHFS